MILSSQTSAPDLFITGSTPPPPLFRSLTVRELFGEKGYQWYLRQLQWSRRTRKTTEGR